MSPSELAQLDRELIARIGLQSLTESEHRQNRRQFWVALAFMSPALILVSTMLLLPVFYNIYFSFTRWKKFAGLDEYAGLANYVKLSRSPFFNEAMSNTALWVVASIVFPLAIGLALAIFLRNIRFEGTIRNIIFLPRILAPTAVGVIWFYVYAPDGILNRIIGFVTRSEVDIGWLYQENTVTPAIIATFVWQSVGLVMVDRKSVV